MRTVIHFVLLLAVGFTSFGFAIAQPADPPVLARIEPDRPVQPGIRPALLVRPDEGKPSRPLSISNVEFDVLVAGRTAQTTVTMTFRNDLDRVLEGNLVFPLPEGSTVGGYALDINGELVEASVVESQQARYIFESEQRKGIDPGLVEWVKGNNFQTRVWPIPAKGTRTVRVMYVSELPVAVLPGNKPAAEGEAAAAAFDLTGALCSLPLKAFAEVDRVKVSVRALNVVINPGWPMPKFDFVKTLPQGPDWVVTADLKKGEVKEDLSLILPVRAQQPHIGSGPRGKGTYFVIRDTPKAPNVRWEPPARGRVIVYWDASHSRSARPDGRDIEALRAALETLAGDAVDVVAFRDRMEKPATFVFDGADRAKIIDAVIRHVKQLPYDGGTNLGNVRIVKNYRSLPGVSPEEAVADYAHALLFTDGLDTIGKAVPQTIEMPVQVFAASAQSNHPLLRLIAAKSGGAYFNLASVSVQDVTRDLSHPPFSFIRADFNPQHVADVYPNTSQPVRGGFTFAGRLLVPETTVTLHYGFGRQHPVTSTITLKQADAANDAAGSLVSRLWAQMKVDSLIAMPDENRAELVATGKEFGLVTPGTSLLVLETLEQYLEHGVEPPASRKQMREQWLAKIEERKVAEKMTREEKLTQVLAMWKEQVAWWEKEFKHPKKVAKDGKEVAQMLRRMRELRGQIEDARGEARSRLERELDELQGRLDRAGTTSAGGAPLAADAPAITAAPARPAPAPNSPAPIRAEPLPQAPGTAARGPVAVADPLHVDGGVRFKNGGGEATRSGPAIALKQWDPKTPYIKAMKDAGPQNAYAVYLDNRNQYASSPAFFFDCADYFFKQKQNDLAVRVLTSVLEMKLEDPRLMRVVAYQLRQHGYLDLAIDLLEKVTKLRPEEPQSLRDLALTLGERADRWRTGAAIAGQGPTQPDPNMAFSDYSRAIGLLNDIVIGAWENRFPEIEVIALTEANRMIARVNELPLKIDWEPQIDRRLRQNLDTDVRIVLTWDTDQTDIDLWVLEPTGERCFYSHPLSAIGGRLSKDFTGGYGPEVYAVRKAMTGGYSILANFYGSREQNLTGGTTILATVYTNFGRKDEERQTLAVRLTTAKEIVDIGTIAFGDEPTK